MILSIRLRRLTAGIRCTFGGFKADRKALVSVHKFVHNYQATFMCETCYAVRPFGRAPGLYNYGDFGPRAAWRATRISHTAYLALEGRSPWRKVRGWHLLLNYEDLMHNVLLGHGGDAVCSVLRDLLDWGLLRCADDADVNSMITELSVEFRVWCRAHRIKYPSGMFTSATLGLDSKGISIAGDARSKLLSF